MVEYLRQGTTERALLRAAARPEPASAGRAGAAGGARCEETSTRGVAEKWFSFSYPLVDRYLRVSRLLPPRPFSLDLVVKTPEEVVQALDRGDAFMREIMARGRVLYKRSA